MAERLQKIIARAGITSRRAGEELILAGRVRVNGRIITELGAKADPRADTIEVDGKRLVSEPPRYIVLHKPRNVVSTLHDPEGRPTVAGLLEPAGSRLYPVGRLDFATSGVLLATNDGDFANGLLHPRGGVPKTYVLKVKGLMSDEDLERWATGVELEDGRTLPAEVRKLRHEDDKTWFEITIREGRNQQIRRMGEATGFPVMRLARTSFAGITSEGLRPGDYRSLTVEELEDLRKRFGVPKKIRGAVLGEHNEAPRRNRRGPAASHEEGPRRAPRDRRQTAGDDRPPRDRRARPERAGDRDRDHDQRREHDHAPREHAPRADRRPRADRERSARPDRGSAPRADRERAPRADRGAAPRADRERAPRADRGAAPRVDRERSARPDRGSAPRADRERSARPDRGSAPRADRGAAPRADRGAGPRADRGAGPRADRERSARPDREHAPRADRGPGAGRERAPRRDDRPARSGARGPSEGRPKRR